MQMDLVSARCQYLRTLELPTVRIRPYSSVFSLKIAPLSALRKEMRLYGNLTVLSQVKKYVCV